MTRVPIEDGFETVDFRAATDAGETSDGWIDAAHDPADNEHEPDLINFSEPGQAAVPVAGNHQAALATSQPAHSNNPFLKQKNREIIPREGQTRDRQHEAAWAELISTPAPAPMPGTGPLQVSSSTLPHTQELGNKGKSRAEYSILDEPAPPLQQASASSSQPSNAPTAGASPLPPPPPRNQTYTIKNVRWLDHSAGDSIRITPILMQNLNGPCPLLALVNALTMSTPMGAQTSLFETLKTREQVSLNLLLEAVVEELMTGRGGNEVELPDMVELYEFLMALHTGMNVNPTFVSSRNSTIPSSLGPNTSSIGDFEPTKELKLYSIFGVPLVHGWLPPESHPAYAALKRSAQTHDEAENLLTREDELEQKLAGPGLSVQEQLLLEDIGSIKYFLNSSTTQLTEYGLERIQDSMKHDSFSILFRNNHFSTLYKHPLTGDVFSLVTDMGYAKYDEIIWESLVDINGAGAELFSGDFRVVSHTAEEAGANQGDSSIGATQGWTTVDRSKSRIGRKGIQPSLQQPTVQVSGTSSSTNEQEDADLALALQLQEEEEQRHRRQGSSQSYRPPQDVPLRRNPSNQTITPQQQQRRRSSQGQQAQAYGITSRTAPGTNRLVIRENNRQQHGIFQDSSTNSSTGNIERPLRGAQHDNSPFSTSTPTPRPRRQRRQDPEAPSDEPPPPTYEDALGDEPYIPPENSAHHHASPLPSPVMPPAGGAAVNFEDLIARTQASEQAAQRTQAANVPASAYAPAPSAPQRRRRSTAAEAQWPYTERANRDKDKDCIVM